MSFRSKLFLLCVGLVFVLNPPGFVLAQNVKRLVIIKADGLPDYYVDRFVRQRNPQTGRSLLPWFEEVFYKNGTRLSNFYSRGLSLSSPVWSLIDTGQHLQVKGNFEYDRFALRSYDYLDFFSYQKNYGLRKQVDMPGVEVLDELRIPLLTDIFTYQKRFGSNQLFQRGGRYGTLGLGFVNLFPTRPNDFLDEWTTGLDFHNAISNQSEREVVDKLVNAPEIDYMDLFTGEFDHVSHQNNDLQSRLNVLKRLDTTIGRIWSAIKRSQRSEETALVLVSDHGLNSDARVYSQGFNLVRLLMSAGGGGHHVVTKRRLLNDYTIKSFFPLISYIINDSNESIYLKGQRDDYPTVLTDLDGNERAALHFRNNDLNILQILFQQIQGKRLTPSVQMAAEDAFFEIIGRHRQNWTKTSTQLNEDLDALRRWINIQQPLVNAQPKKWSKAELTAGNEQAAVRRFARLETAKRDESRYRRNLQILERMISLTRDSFNSSQMKITDLIAPGAMGERNSIYDLQNYVIGLSERGLTLDSAGRIDFDKSFTRVNYFEFFADQRVLNNVQPGLGNRPVDFIAARIDLDSIKSRFASELMPTDDPIWLYGGLETQALIMTRSDDEGNRSFRYLPISGLRQQSDGMFTFQVKEWGPNFPLRIFEDANLQVPGSEKTDWLNQWHTELEWFHATHKTKYSNAVISLNEQLQIHPLTGFENKDAGPSEDDMLNLRFRKFQRNLNQAELLILANDHWNFDVRGFNPGGNHGSFFRVSTNSTLMLAGGSETRIPKGLTVEEPYDSLSVMPTILGLMGKIDAKNEPDSELYRLGFRKFPGRLIREVFGRN